MEDSLIVIPDFLGGVLCRQGDIVLVDDSYGDSYLENWIGVVVMGELYGHWFSIGIQEATRKKIIDLPTYGNDIYFTVLGNIYENHELVEKYNLKDFI